MTQGPAHLTQSSTQTIPSIKERMIDLIPQQSQRQDSLDDQLRDLQRAANKLGCYDAADWIRSRTL